MNSEVFDVLRNPLSVGDFVCYYDEDFKEIVKSVIYHCESDQVFDDRIFVAGNDGGRHWVAARKSIKISKESYLTIVGV